MVLLEREMLLGELGGLLRGAAGGAGCVAFVGGEAGVGKSTLVRAFAGEVRRTARVLVGACDPVTTPRPLGPLADMATLAGGEIERLIDGNAARDQIFRASLRDLAESERVTLAIVEDAHWADDATLDWLRFLGRRIGMVRALIVVTYRADEVGPRHPLRVLLGDLATAPALRRLRLSPLSVEAVRTLAKGSGIGPDALHQLTGGNPFFVTEILAAGATGPSPTVRDAVLARVARLSPEGRAALETAAVIGSRMEPWLLAALGVDEAAEEAIEQGMLRAEGQQLAFRHELARVAIVEAIPPLRARALHKAVLAALRDQPTRVGDPARLARHAEEANDPEAVAEYAVAAGRQAARLGANREAAAQFARAIRFGKGLAPAERAGLLEGYADACVQIDRLDEAIRVMRDALALWREAGDREKEGMLLCSLAPLLVNAGKHTEGNEAIEAALAALEGLPPGRPLANAYRARAGLHMIDRDEGAAITWAEKAIVLAEGLGAEDIVASALNVIGTMRVIAGDERGVECFERCLEVSRAGGYDSIAALAYSNLGSSLAEMHLFGRADAVLSEGIAFCEERDLDRPRAYMAAWWAVSCLHLGRWGAAAEAALAVVNRPNAMAVGRMRVALATLGRLRGRRGDPEVAGVLDEALALAGGTGAVQQLAPVRAARAEAFWLAGDAERTLEEANAVYELAVGHGHPWFLGELAYWLWRAGGLELAPTGAARPYALQIAGEWAEAAAEWERLGCPYEAARALAEGDDAEALRRALVVFERLGARPMAQATARRLRDLGARGIPRGPRPATRTNPGGLTAREAEIAGLLAEGLRNAEIAARLFVSAKTVEHHISAVLAKLGVTSRAEAAREAARMGLGGETGDADRVDDN